MQNQCLLYGANGYTGALIARHAAEYNITPVLAGRREQPLKALADKLSLSYKVFDVNNTTALMEALQQVKVVVNAAGPFDYTAKPFIDACLKTGTHYLDINGDMEVFEMLYNFDAEAKLKRVMIMSGVGFDVVPTDCTALFLKKRLPDATSLQIAFATPGGALSHGTAITTAQKLGEPGAERQNGKIVPVPVGQKGMRVDFGDKKLFVMSLPWGDVFTAYHTTGIPNIITYTAVSPALYYFLKFQFLFNWLLRTGFVRNIVKKQIHNKPPGLDDEKRSKSTSVVWGQVANNAGKKATARVFCPDAYTLTAYSTLLIVQKVLAGEVKPGYQTPAGVYGEDLVMEVPGVKRESI